MITIQAGPSIKALPHPRAHYNIDLGVLPTIRLTLNLLSIYSANSISSNISRILCIIFALVTTRHSEALAQTVCGGEDFLLLRLYRVPIFGFL